MRAPAFWWTRGSLAGLALSPLGWVYGAITGRRMARPGAKAGVPVLCVGNVVAGGQGKTPTALALARMLRASGRAPVFLSRGYGGRFVEPTLVDPARHKAADCGDEPLLLAREAPTVVAGDRIAGAALAARHGNVIVMDDGLQNPGLAKDLAFAVVDGASGIGNGYCVPAGPLRAPLPAQWPHVDAVVVIGPGEPGDAMARDAARRGKPVLRASLEPSAASVQDVAGQDVLAFAGIGRPGKLFDSLGKAGARLLATRAFPDHHAYTRDEIEALLSQARADSALAVTTEKDMVRLTSLGVPLDAIVPFAVTLVFADEAAVAALLGTLSQPGGR